MLPKPKLDVLLVEDNPTDVLLVRQNLEQDKSTEFRVTVVETLDEGLSAQRQSQFDVVLLDLGLPDSIGLETFERWHAQSSEVPVLVCSGMQDEQAAIQAVRMGAQDYLVKDDLQTKFAVRAIQYAIERARLNSSLRESEQRFATAFFTNAVSQSIISLTTGAVVEVNNACCSLYGYSRAELVGNDPEKFNLWANSDEHMAALEELQKSGHLLPKEVAIRNKSGEIRTVLFTAEPITWQGTPCLITSSVDITERKRAEEQLRQSEANLVEAQREAKLGSWRFNIATNAVSWSEELYQVFDMDKGEFAGMYQSFLNSVHPDDKPRVLETNRLARETGDPFQVEYRITTRSGQLKHIHEHGYATKDTNGNVVGLFGIAQDVTERKRTEEKLREGEERLSLVMDGSQLGYWDWNIKANTVYRNKRWAEMLGYTLEEIEFNVKQWTDLHHPDDRERAWKSIQDHLEGKTPAHRIEYRMRTKDGQYKWILDQAMVVKRDADGTPLRMCGTHTDITERKQAEAALADTEQRFRALIERSSDGIVVMSAQGQVLYESPSATRLIGFTPEERTGKSGFENIYPDDLSQARAKFAQVASQPGGTVHVEYRAVRKDGSLWWAESVATNLLNDPVVQGIVVNFRDVTERKQAEEKLRESEERFRSVFESSGAVMLLIEPESGAIIDANPAAVKFYGYSREKLGTMKIDQINQFPIDQVFAERQQAQREERNYFVFPHRLADGSLRTVEVYSNPFQTQGRTLLYSIVLDITERKRAEEQLETSERTLKLFVEYAPAAIAMFDTEMKYVIASQRYLSDYRLGTQDLTGRSHYEVFPEMNQTHKDLHRRCLAGEVVKCDEDRLPRMDGTVDWVSYELRPWHQANGDIGGLIFFSEVITERKQAEEKLQASRQQLQALVTSLDDIVFLVDERGTYLDVWTSNETLLFQPREQIIGRRFDEIFGVEAARPFFQTLEQVLTSDATSSLEYPVKLPDGARWFVAQYNLIRSQEHLPKTVSILVRDITDRKQAEEKLRDSEFRLRAMLDAIPDMMFRLDRQGVFLDYKADVRDLHAQSQPTLVGLRNRDVTPAEFADLLEQKIEATLESGQLHIFEYQLPIPNADMQNFEARMSPSGTDQVVAIVRNVTERKKTEQALAQNEKSFRELFEGNPLPMWVYDPTTLAFLAVNDSAVINYGYTRDEFLGMTLRDIRPPEDLVKLEGSILHRPAPYEISGPWRHIKKDRTPILVQISSHEIAWQGHPAVMVAAIDRTTEYTAEEKLRASEIRFRELAESIQEVFWVYDYNVQKITYISPGYEQVWERTVASLYQDPRSYIESILPEDRPVMFDALERQARGEPTKAEYRIMHPDGRIRWIWDRGFPIIEHGKPVRVIGVAADITERKQAEIRLRESEKRFVTIFETSPGAIGIARLRDNHMTDVNPAWTKVMEYSRDQVIGHTGLELGFWVQPSERQRLMEQLRSEKHVFNFETSFRSKSGIEHNVLLSAETVDINGETSLLIQFTDITERKRAEIRLRDSEEKYRSLIESSEAIIATIDREGVYRYLNHMAAETLGSTPETLVGKQMQDYFTPDTAEYQLNLIRQVIDSGRGAVVEAPTIIMDQPRWYRTSIQPIFNADGTANQVMFNSIDITDRKETERVMEERVKQATTEIRDLYDNAPTGYHSLDSDGKFMMINQTELNWLGYPREEVLGRPFTQFITPESLPTFQNNFPVFKQRGWVRDLEFELVRKDGTRLPVLVNAVLVKDEHGNYLTSRSTVFDNTERKKAEQALRESEEQNRLLFEQSPDAVLLMDEQGVIVRMNNAVELLTGYPSNQLVGRTLDCCNILPSEQIQLFATQVVKSLAEQTSFASVEFKIKRADDEIRDVGTRVFGLMLKGHPHYLTTMRDITLEKQTEETLRASRDTLSQANRELARASTLKDEFLANMSHELRTPLNAILGLSEGLLEQFMGTLNEKQIKAITMIESSGQHLLTLINDILDLSKIEAGKMTVEIVPVAVQSVTNSSLAFVKELAQRKNIQLLTTHDPTIEWIMADERRLKQMLINLLNNAVKFTPEGGNIELAVTSDAQNNRMSFSVRDTGIGIAPEDFTRLFKPFVQVDGSMTRSHEGTGLGLSLVARMAEMHGGSVSVASELGKGSCFTISLPWSNEMQNYAAARTKQSIQRLNQSVVTQMQSISADAPLVLIAEDNETNITMLSLYLESKGYRLAIARNGSEALTKAGEEHPAIILMDLQMPVLNGLEATRRLRQMNDSPLAHTPIIALTALAMPGDRESAITAGANEYMSKPVNLNQLVEMIEHLRSK